MPTNTIKARATVRGGVVTYKALINHPMDTGLVKDKKTGKLIPAHFIQEVTATHNGKQVMTADWGGAISRNPYVSFQFTDGKAGDSVTLSWMDNKGEKDSLTTKIR